MNENAELRERNTSKTRKLLAVLKLSLLAVFIIVLPAIIYLKYGSYIFTKNAADNLIAYLNAHRDMSFLIICALQILQVVVCIIPGQPIQIAASYMFGVPVAMLVSWAGAIVGAAIAFYIARILGRDAMHVLFGEDKIEEYRSILNSAKGIITVFIIYLIPGIPKDLAGYAAGVSEMRFPAFLAASILGRSPSMFCSILFGHFLKTKNFTALIILSVFICIIVIVCIIKRKSIYDFIDRLSQKSEADRTDG